ncbi:MAG: THUMP domain-containing protein [Nitrososphaera sp.]
MKDFNLLVSTFRFSEEFAQDEIMDLLEDLGDSEHESEISNVTGLILCRTSLDPFKAIEQITELVRSEPWHIRYLLRVIPIERAVEADTNLIAEAAASIGRAKMVAEDTFRITVEKRHSQLSSREVIESVAKVFSNKVRLENPDWVVLVEIVGATAGVSVLKPGQIFSSTIEKRHAE